jgi:hypothetical protein
MTAPGSVCKGEKMDFSAHLKRIVVIWLFFGIVIALFATNGIKMAHISRDPAHLADFPLYYGLLSNIGILIWTAGASVALFSSFLLPAGKERSLLRWAGILTLILTVDDFFLLHDAVFPGFLHIDGLYFYLFYLLAFPLFFFLHLRVILERTEYRILALGLFLLGTSLLIDLELLPGGIDVEDSFKIAGLATYAYYWILSSFHLLAPSRLELPLTDEAEKSRLNSAAPPAENSPLPRQDKTPPQTNL